MSAIRNVRLAPPARAYRPERPAEAGGRGLAWRGLGLLAGLLVASWVVARALEAAGGAEAVVAPLGAMGPLVLGALHALVAFTPFLGETLAVANALLYGLWGGAAISWCAWMVTSALQYEAVRLSLVDLDLDGATARLPAALRRVPMHHPLFLIGVRIPFGGPLANAAAAAAGVSLGRHLACAAVGIAPRALFFASLAAGARHVA